MPTDGGVPDALTQRDVLASADADHQASSLALERLVMADLAKSRAKRLEKKMAEKKKHPSWAKATE